MLCDKMYREKRSYTSLINTSCVSMFYIGGLVYVRSCTNGTVGHLQKLCKLLPHALIYLKGAMLIYRPRPP